MFAALAIGACSDGSGRSDPTTSTTASPSSAATTSTSVVDPGRLRALIGQLARFEVDPQLQRWGCRDLVVSNGDVAVRAAVQRDDVFQEGVALTPDEVTLTVEFGADLPGLACTDLGSEVIEATITDRWPATAGSATWDVVPTPSCTDARLRLDGVVATAPDGTPVALGDLVIENPNWFSEPPSECRFAGVPEVCADGSVDTQLTGVGFFSPRAWTHDGCLVRADVIFDTYGAAECGTADVRKITIGDAGEVPDREYQGGTTYAPAGEVTMPGDAVDTGYRSGAAAMWAVPGDPSSIYLVVDARVERWTAIAPVPCT